MSDGQAVPRRTVLKLSAAALGGAAVPAAATRAKRSGRGPADQPGAPRDRRTPRPGRESSSPALFGRTEWDRQGTWTASWVRCPDRPRPPVVTAYRLRFRVAARLETVLRVSADERYEMFLDGERIGRGSERGNLESWFYETLHLFLEPGEHVLVARVWSLGSYAPITQIAVEPAFLLAAPEEHETLLGTGASPRGKRSASTATPSRPRCTSGGWPRP